MSFGKHGNAPSVSARPMHVLFALLLILSLSFSEFSLKSLSVFINVNKDGSVNVEERIEIVIRTAASRELYETTRAIYSDIATWKNRTQLSEMRHHISRASAEISDLRVIPTRVERCNSLIGTCYAEIILDYTLPATQNGSGLIKVERYKPRTARYSLFQEALSFEQTKSGDIVLPVGTNISIAIPPAAEKIHFSTLPDNLNDEPQSFRYDQSANQRYYTGTERIFTWRGDTLSKFEFTYEIESSLESEVLEFFSEIQKAATGIFMGQEGPAAIILFFFAIATFYYFHSIKK